MQLCNGILRGHHHLQQIRKRTFRTFARNFHQTKISRIKTEIRKMLLLQETHTIPWTLISTDGIQPLPEKLESIAKMPAPKNPKEVKQFLELVGYCRKFFPRFADISQVLTHLTKNDVDFKWTSECENCFQILKEFLQQAPILRYPDPQANYTSTQMHQNTHTQAY